MNPETIAILERMALAYPSRELKPGTIAQYAEDLAEIPATALESICQMLRRTEEWFPSISKFHEAWFTLYEQAMGWPSAAQSLESCVRTMNQVGSGLYDVSSGYVRCPDEFTDPLTTEAVRLFGWQRIASSDDNEWLAREWAKTFQQARENVRRQFVSGGPDAIGAGRPTTREIEAAMTVDVEALPAKPGLEVVPV